MTKEDKELLIKLWKSPQYSDFNFVFPRWKIIWLRIKASILIILGKWLDDLDYENFYDLHCYDESTWSGEYGEHRGWSILYVKIKGFGIYEGYDSTP